MQHTIKCESQYFQAILDGRKTFEIRLDDRGYNAGDTVFMQEIDPDYDLTPGRWTGRKLTADIGYVTAFKQQDRYVVFSLLNVKLKE